MAQEVLVNLITERSYIHKEIFKNIAIPDSNIIIENNSKTLMKNAIFTKHILDSIHFKGSILLVTSSFHMRRSLAIFEKQDTKYNPHVNNKITGIRKFEFDCFIPNTEAICFKSHFTLNSVGLCYIQNEGIFIIL